MKKITDIITVVVFALIIILTPIAHFAIEDKDLLVSERRKPEIFPKTNMESIMSGDFSDGIESYMLDHFPWRDRLRFINSFVDKNLFLQLDINGYYMSGDYISKRGEKPKINQVEYAANKINKVINKYFPDNKNIFYAVIPDKEIYAGLQSGYNFADYQKMIELVESTVKGATRIELFDKLALSDFYKTDTHWRQEKIVNLAQFIAKSIDSSANLIPKEGFTHNTLENYYGIYSSQSAFSTKPENMTYLTSNTLDSAYVTGAEFTGQRQVYQTELFESAEPYDLYAGGAKAIITLHSPKAKTDKEMVIFRDSFGSSIAPLFCEQYSKVTLVDLRYVAADYIGQFVELNENQDVLFLYSYSLFNSGMLLK